MHWALVSPVNSPHQKAWSLGQFVGGRVTNSHVKVSDSQFLVLGTLPELYTSRLDTFSALVWMKSRRGSTTSPIRVENTSSASSA